MTPGAILRARPSGGRPGRSADFFAGTVLANVRRGVQVIAAEAPRTSGIEEVPDDPCYENLYDRFYAIMSDGAALEHLAVADLALDDIDVRQIGTRSLTALTSAWRAEATREVGYGNAYATSRLLKSLAVGHAAFGADLNSPDRGRVTQFLRDLAGRLWREWFSREDVRGRTGIQPGRHSPHHASVEWSGFGVAALALMHEVDEAQDWVEAAVTHFTSELLPHALAVDGAPPEGWDFWVSTMFSRVQFLEALRNVTGTDLLPSHLASMRTELAEVLLRRIPPLDNTDDGECRLPLDHWPLLPRGGGTVLLWLAGRLDDPRLQAVGMLDGRAGSLESSSFALPRSGTRLRFATSSYAALWMSTEVEPAGSVGPSVAAFPSVGLCATSRGWRSSGFAAAIDQGRVVLWAGDALVVRDLVPEMQVDLEASRAAGTGISSFHPADLHGPQVGATPTPHGDLLEARTADGQVVVRVVVATDGRSVRVERRLAEDHRWRTNLELEDADDGRWRLTGSGMLVQVRAEGCTILPGAPARVATKVGYGLLECRDDPSPVLSDHHLVRTAGQSWCTLELRIEPGPTARSSS